MEPFTVFTIIFGALLLIVGWGLLYMVSQQMPAAQRKRRREEIEIAMRQGLADEEMKREIAEKLLRERQGNAG